MPYAPIALFVYKRIAHPKKVIQSLLKNKEAKDSELYIFSDGPKNAEEIEPIAKVQKYIHTVEGFKAVHIIERKQNFGLAKSIISGVTEVVNTYGNIIVLESDIVVSPFFLQYINRSLQFYQLTSGVWHISGWNYPIDPSGLNEMFFTRIMNCWGWATWLDRWQYFEKKPKLLVEKFSNDDIYRFNLNGAYNFWKHVLQNKSGKINTWAIFWYATIFQNGGLCVNPSTSYTRNIGFDDAGTHTKAINKIETALCNREMKKLDPNPLESPEGLRKIRQYYHGEFFRRKFRFVQPLLGY